MGGSGKMKIAIITNLLAKRNMDINTCQILKCLFCNNAAIIMVSIFHFSFEPSI